MPGVDYRACFSHAGLLKRMNGIQSCFQCGSPVQPVLGASGGFRLHVCILAHPSQLSRQSRSGLRMFGTSITVFRCATCVLPVHLQPILRSGGAEDAIEWTLGGGVVDDAMILLLEVYWSFKAFKTPDFELLHFSSGITGVAIFIR